MNLLSKILSATTIALTVGVAYASPKHLITHNRTGVESNAFIGGFIPSVHPTKAHSDGKVGWHVVRIACTGLTENGKCSALIKMDTKGHPVDIGIATMDLESGHIKFEYLNEKNCAYVFTINGPGETTITHKK